MTDNQGPGSPGHWVGCEMGPNHSGVCRVKSQPRKMRIQTEKGLFTAHVTKLDPSDPIVKAAMTIGGVPLRRSLRQDFPVENFEFTGPERRICIQCKAIFDPHKPCVFGIEPGEEDFCAECAVRIPVDSK